MFNLMKVDPLVYISISPIKATALLIQAKLHGTKANVPSAFSKYIKTV